MALNWEKLDGAVDELVKTGASDAEIEAAVSELAAEERGSGPWRGSPGKTRPAPDALADTSALAPAKTRIATTLTQRTADLIAQVYRINLSSGTKFRQGRFRPRHLATPA